MSNESTFDLVDYPHPAQVTIVRDGKPNEFALPYTTADMAEKAMLRSHPGMVEVTPKGNVKQHQPKPETKKPEPDEAEAPEESKDAPDAMVGLRRKGGDQ